MLTGCATTKFATVKAFCAALPQAKYEVRGRTKYDQSWIDGTYESEIAGCKWERPERRPPNVRSLPPIRQPSPTVTVGETFTSSPSPSSGTETREVPEHVSTRRQRIVDKIHELSGALHRLEGR